MPDQSTDRDAALHALLSWAKQNTSETGGPIALSRQEVARLVLAALEEVPTP